MPRPKSKDQLLEQARQNWEKLQAEVDQLTEDQITEADIVGDWSVKDVLAHLTEWQKMTLAWYCAGKAGETPITPSETYTWRQIPDLNRAIYEKHKDSSLDKIQANLLASHKETINIIEQISNEELFTPKVYKWTKSTTLGSYFTSATSSHYDWAYKEIRKGLKAKYPAK